MSFVDLFVPSNTIDFYAQFLEEGGRDGYLVFSEEGVAFHPPMSGTESVEFAADEIVDVVVHEDAQESQRVTFTRLLFFRIFALAMPKKTRHERTLVVLVLSDGSEAAFALQDKKASTVWQQIEGFVTGYSGTFVDDTQISVADELAHLAELHDQGVLSDIEFENAKKFVINGGNVQ